MLRRTLTLVLVLGCIGCDDEPDLPDDPPLTVPGQEVPDDPPPPEPGQLPPGMQANSEFSPLLVVPGTHPMPEAPLPQLPQMPPATPVPLVSGFQPQPMVAGGMLLNPPVAANTLGPDCRGFVNAAPNHILQLGSAFQNLRILVNSTVDTVLVVRGPEGSVRCNDDYAAGSVNPAVEGTYAPGVYQVFVGTYQRAAQAQYTIGFTELPQGQTTQLPLPGSAPTGTAPQGTAPPGSQNMQPMMPTP